MTAPRPIPAPVAALLSKYVANTPGDGEHAAIAVLLANRIAHDPLFASHVSASGIYWDDLLAAPWPSADAWLFQVAAGLWGIRDVSVDMSRLAFLNAEQYSLFLDMVTARMTGRIPTRQDEE